MLRKSIKIIAILLLTFTLLHGQDEKFISFDFDDCTGFGKGYVDLEADVQGAPNCDCGVAGSSFTLDGNNDRILFPDTLRELFEDDFTISFYFAPRNQSGTIDIFSFRTTCDKDSSLSIVYRPEEGTVRAEIAESFRNIYELKAPVSSDKCWIQVTLAKFGLVYSLYIDGNLEAQEVATRIIPFGKEAKMWIANSPCIVFTEDRLQGGIDEVEIYNYAISNTEIASLYLSPDQILTADTTIFIGETVQLELGPTCATNITWSPSEGLNEDDIIDPVVTGVQTTDYAVQLSNSICVSRDTVRINVVDPDALQCDDLLLPKAFTPNNDGLNEFYRISNAFIVESLISFEIFDRWGERVYLGTNKIEGWDGNFKGQEVNPGMFLYKIKYTCENTEFVKVDNFSVLR